MTHFFKTLTFGAVLFASCSVFAQTVDSSVNGDEFEDKDAEKPFVIKPKTDEQIQYEDAYIPENWDQMTQKEQEEYAFEILQDRFLLSTMNFKIITSGRTKLCTFNVILHNNSPRKIKKMYVKYTWGDSSTFASFGAVEPQSASVGTISMVGDVCSRLTKGADYEVKTCEVEGLTDEQCRMRVYPVK